MKKSTTKFYNWAIQKANSPKAPLWFGLLFLLELFLLIPLDAVMMFFCLQNRSNIPLYIAIAALASTVSGLIGYLIGHFLWDLIDSYIVPHLIAQHSFDTFSNHFQTYETWAVFFGGLIPFPLKILSVISGVFKFGILPFTLCLFSARLLRFSIIGVTMALWGVRVKAFVDRHFHRIFLVIGAKVAAAALFFWILAR